MNPEAKTEDNLSQTRVYAECMTTKLHIVNVVKTLIQRTKQHTCSKWASTWSPSSISN